MVRPLGKTPPPPQWWINAQRKPTGAVTMADRIAELVTQHGSLRAAARVLYTDASYLSRLATGEKDDPGPALLRRMGLRRVVTYKRISDDQP